MKRFFLLLCVLCGLYGLSWGHGFGESTEGTFSTVTFTHTTDCDSARVYFGYPSSNLYYSLKLFPLPADNRKLLRDSLDLDSIGGHYIEARYYEQGAGSVSGYSIGEWVHETDSVYKAITNVNKVNFKADVDGVVRYGYPDSILQLGALHIRASGNDTAIVATGAGSGGGVLFKSGATGLFGFESIAVPNGGRGIYAYGQAAGIFGQGSLSGMRLEGVDAFLTIGTDYGILATGGGAGISAAGSGNGDGFLVARAGTGKDINLNGDGRIHGTIDSATAVALGSADADTLAKIRDYAHAVQESINAHAPHGDDWASVGAGGADLSDEVDSLLAVLYDRTNDSNFVRLMAHVILHGDLSTFDESSDSVMTSNPPAYKADVSGLSTFDPSSDVVVRVTYVDSAETVITQPAGGSGSDTTAIKAMHDNRGTSIFDPTSDVVARVTFVDSTDTIIKSIGATATVDTESVARSVWDDDIVPQASRTVTASCAGSGTDTLDLYIFNGDTTAIEGVQVTVWNKGRTAKAVLGVSTDVNGKVQLGLSADTFHVRLHRLGVIYSQWDTVVVPSGGGIDTIWVTSYDPGSAPSGNVTRVKGFNRDFGFNKGERLTVTFSLPYKNVIDTSQNVFIDRKEIVVFSDTGYFEADLIPGIKLLSQVSGAVKDSLKYNVKISAPDRPVFEWNRFDVPDTTGTVWLIDLIR